MGVSCFEPQIAVHSYSKMKAFVAALSSLAAASGTQILPAAGLAPFAYAHAPAFAPIPAALAYGSPYDYAGQVYPLAEPYVHKEIPAEEYVHEEIPAEEYVHTEVAAEPYVHEEVAAEPYVHAEIAAEPYVHQEPVVVAAAPVAAPAPLAYAPAPLAAAPFAYASAYAHPAAYPYTYAGFPYNHVIPAAAVKA